jgi:diamine N-acetyltransferase
MISSNDDTVYGIIDLFQFDPKNKRVGIGILVHKDYRKQGIATESIALIKEYCFNHLNIHQIWCTISTQNTESISLFSKAEFEQSGLLKQWNINYCNHFEDVLIMQCIKKTS